MVKEFEYKSKNTNVKVTVIDNDPSSRQGKLEKAVVKFITKAKGESYGKSN